MKTKFILHGGFSREHYPLQEDDAFFGEIFKDAPDNIQMLLVYFAEREDMLSLRIRQDTQQCIKNSGSKKIEFRVAIEEAFERDCAWAHVIYFHGGATAKLMAVLEKYPDIKEMLAGKIIAGDSAGANSFAHVYFSKNAQAIGSGLGILPFKIVAHYEEGISNPLADVESQYETLFLKEYETKVVYI